MRFAGFLQENIDKELSEKKWKKLKSASENLSHNYRKFCRASFLSEEEYLAYLSCRLPATYAVCTEVFSVLSRSMPHFQPKSLLDVGSGPGTGLFACKEVFSSLSQATLIEREGGWIDIAQRLSLGIDCSIVWQKKDIEKEGGFSSHSIILLSYSLGEVSKFTLPRMEELWHATEDAFVIIEPGTPKGFASIWAMREKLISWGATLLAPCPHASACPMRGQDWCHFFARVQRSALHRHLKGGKLGYEDEKFSYIIAVKNPIKTLSVESRIIRPAAKRSGHVFFTLCKEEGLVKTTISKKQGELYEKVKKLDWGDGF